MSVQQRITADRRALVAPRRLIARTARRLLLAVLVVAAGAAGTGVAWYRGQLEANLDQNIEAVFAASQKALTQLEFAARLGVPVETIRNWEQGKRVPRGPARALLAVAVVALAPPSARGRLPGPASGRSKRERRPARSSQI